jgi:TetR/AcrR family transcriptional regulator
MPVPGLTGTGGYLPFGRLMRAPSATTRDKVLLAAIQAFAQGGYAGTSVQEILAATGLSKPTLYYHFGSKQGLFRAILDYAHDLAHERMVVAAARATTCRERLTAIAAALFDYVETHRDLTRLVFASTFAAPRELPPEVINVDKRRRNFEFVQKVVREGRRLGELSRAHSVRDLTHGIYGAISHRIRMRLLLPGQRLRRREAERLVELFFAGAAQPN